MGSTSPSTLVRRAFAAREGNVIAIVRSAILRCVYLATLLPFCVSCTSEQGIGGGDLGRADKGDVCQLPTYADDIVLREKDRVALPNKAYRAVTIGQHTLVCGKGYLAAVKLGETIATLTDPRFDGPCAVASNAQDKAAVVTRSGDLFLVTLDASGRPQVLDHAGTADATFHDVAIAEGRVWVAAGKLGVLGYSFDKDRLGDEKALPAARDARSVLPLGASLLVADGFVAGVKSESDETRYTGGGAEIRLLSLADGGEIAKLEGLKGMATRVIGTAERAIVLRPGHGFDVLEIGDSAISLAYSHKVEQGFPVDALLDGEMLLIAAGSRLQRYALSAKSARWVSTEDRPSPGQLDGPWFRALSRVGTEVVAITDDAVIPLELGAGLPGPEIDIEQQAFSLSSDQKEALFKVGNIGNQTLIISSVTADAPFSAAVYADLAVERKGCPGHYLVEPGEVFLAWERYGGDASWQTAAIRIASNDADEPELKALAEIHRQTAKVGDLAEDFELLAVGGASFRLAQHRRKVILAKLYNPL